MESGVIWQYTFIDAGWFFSCFNWHIIKFSGREGGRQGERKGRIPASQPEKAPLWQKQGVAKYNCREYSYLESCLSLTGDIKQGLDSVVKGQMYL